MSGAASKRIEDAAYVGAITKYAREAYTMQLSTSNSKGAFEQAVLKQSRKFVPVWAKSADVSVR